MEAYSLDLRERICDACDEGLETREEVAERFGVSRSFVQKLLRRRKSGSIAPKPKGRGPQPLIGDQDLRRVRTMVKDRRDATLAELCVGLASAGGVVVSRPTMCRALKALRLPLKKRRCMRPSGRRRAFERFGGIGKRRSARWMQRSWYS